MGRLGSDKTIERTALLMLASGVFALSVRMALAPLSSFVFFVVLFTLACLTAAYLTIRFFNLHRLGAYFIVAIATLSLGAIAAITGGLSSPIIILFPVVPVAASLLFKGPVNWILSGFFILLTVAFTGFDATRYAPENLSFTEIQLNTVRAAWIIIGVFVVTTFAAFFSIENRKLTEALHKEAHMDYLTHLPNRRGVEQHLETELANSKRKGHLISVIMIDIDHFKRYNDINGHAKGDECIRCVAAILEDNLSSPDEFVGRYGGDEFIAALSLTDRDSAVKKAEELRRSVEQLNIAYSPDYQQPLTITLGCYTVDAKKISQVDQLIYEADHALYQGKAHSRNQVTTSG